MKKLFCTYRVGLFCMMLCSMFILASCNGGGVSGNAPKDVKGKTFNLINKSGKHIWTIEFSSNSSARVTRLFDHEKEAPTNASYQKTGDDSALLQLLYFDGSIYSEFSLLFASPNQGAATGNSTGTTFTLF